MESKCKSCIYRARPGSCYQCDYAYIMGTTRLAVPAEKCRSYQKGPRMEGRRTDMVTPGEGLDLWQPTQAIRTREQKRKKRDVYDWKKAETLYEAGATDQEIMDALGIKSKSTVERWRYRTGRRINMARKGPPKKYDWDRAETLWKEGLTDREIQQALGVKSKSTVTAWRDRMGLAPNPGQVGRPKGRTEQKSAEETAEKGEDDRMKEETIRYIRELLALEKDSARSDLERDLMEGRDGKNRLEQYRNILNVIQDFEKEVETHVR